MVHTLIRERQAIIVFNIFKIHTFSNLSELYEILTWKAMDKRCRKALVKIVRKPDLALRFINILALFLGDINC